MATPEPRDDAALEQLLRDHRLGPPGPGEVTPWDFIQSWSDAYVRTHVWPVVSRMLVDDDPTMRARAIEFATQWSDAAASSAPRLIEVAEQHADLFSDELVNGQSLRVRLANAMANLAGWKPDRRLATAILKVADGAPMTDGPARVVARFDPKLAAEHARRWGSAAMEAIRAATETVARLRRDDLVGFLSQLGPLRPAERDEVLGIVESAIYRDDTKAALATKTYSMPAPQRPAPSVEECRRAMDAA